MNQKKKGIISAVIAYIMWGLYPLYWRMLQTVGPTEILINRMFWSFITLLLFLIGFNKISSLVQTVKSIVNNKKKLILLICAAALLGTNWFIFTYAIVSGRIIEASLGYFINPIFSIVIGVIVLKERLNQRAVLAVMIASLGVVYLTVSYGILPWISLLLAVTWGFYALIKKILSIEPFQGLFLETLIMLPVSGFFFFSTLIEGTSAFSQNNFIYIILLIGAGFITVSPLYFFSKATRILPLSVIGFLQYIGPTLQLLVAVIFTGEELSSNRLISFLIIWIACLVFSTSYFVEHKKN